MLSRSRSYSKLPKRKASSSGMTKKKSFLKRSLSFISGISGKSQNKSVFYGCTTDSPSTFEAELGDQESNSPNDPDFLRRASFRWKQKNNYDCSRSSGLSSPPIAKGSAYPQWPPSPFESEYKANVSSQNFSRMSARVKSTPNLSGLSAKVPSSPNCKGSSTKVPSFPSFSGSPAKVPSFPNFSGSPTRLPNSPSFSGSPTKLLSSPNFRSPTKLPSSPNFFGSPTKVPSSPNFSGPSTKVRSAPNFSGMLGRVPSTPNYFGMSAKVQSAPNFSRMSTKSKSFHNSTGMIQRVTSNPNFSRMSQKVKSSNFSGMFQKVKSSPNIAGMASPNFSGMSEKVKTSQIFFPSSTDQEVRNRNGSTKKKQVKNGAANHEGRSSMSLAIDDSVVDAVLREAKKKNTNARITAFQNVFSLGQQQWQNASSYPTVDNTGSSPPKGLKSCSKSYHCDLSRYGSSDTPVTQLTFEDIFVTEPAIADNFAIMFPTEPRPEWHRHLRQVLQKAGQKIFKKPEHHDTNIPENLRYQLKQIYVY
ncbi:uncharacterized protein [Macrobrachium rosenbergii]|uniref:uncharacterized protein isoform X1 n=1 Tax=Macrobrachium rosenbergii TaxID=79674 RepID=UPI0034D62228